MPQINLSSRDSLEEDNTRPLPQEKTSMCNRSVSLRYTLSYMVTSLTGSSLGGERFSVNTNHSSPSSMSLEKRVRMRPRGVVSKKCIGLSRSRWNSLSWSTEAAFTVDCQHKRQPCFNIRSDTCKQTTWRNIREQSNLG